MSTGQYFRVNRALLRSVQLSDTSSGDEHPGGQLGEVCVSSSVERQSMREQLDAVRQTLNSLATAAQQPAAAVVNAAGLEVVLSDIATKLTSIEGLYSNLTNKLEKVDLRVEDSERHIKDLQHFSASTIHETARLVDYVGSRTTTTRAGSQAGAGPSGVGTSPVLRPRHMAGSSASGAVPTTPPPPGLSPSRGSSAAAVAAMEYVPSHVTASIQQHAAQIHKLIAGLDFLEAHIIRQDQVVEGLQKQLVSVARDVASSAADSRTSPSELSLRVHDMGELLNKLRAHMYKVEKKTGNNDQAVGLLTQRLQTMEAAVAAAARQQQHRGPGSSPSNEQCGDSVPGPSAIELAAAQEELRSTVQDLCRDVLELKDQLRDQTAAAAAAQPPPAPAEMFLTAAEGADMRHQLSYLMSQLPALLVENKELKDLSAASQKRIDDLFAALDQQRCQLVQQQTTGSTPAAVEQLRAFVVSLQGQVMMLESRLAGAVDRTDIEALTAALQAVEHKVVPAAGTGESVAVRESISAVRARVEALEERLGERAEEAAALRAEVQALVAEQQQCRCRPAPDDMETALPPPVTAPAGATGAAEARRVDCVGSGSPEAAVLASQVSAAAKADLEEQFGQLRHRVEVSMAAAVAAEESARMSAESAAAAAAAVGMAGQAAVSAALQESVLAMAAGVEREQAGLKQQLAQLAAQVSEEQAAISAGLHEVQQQVAAAAAAATEAAACAQAVHREQRERESAPSAAEELRTVQAELREQVASVMEQLKGRVEQGMQEVDVQLSALSDRLGSAVTTSQLEAALREALAAAISVEQLEASLEALRAAAADASERHELEAASLEDLRSDLILLTGAQDVMQSRLQGLEALLGVDARSSPLGAADGRSVFGARTSGVPPTIEEGDEEAEGEDDGEEAAAERGAAADNQVEEMEDGREEAAPRGGLPARGPCGLSILTGGGLISGGRGLLDLVAELQLRVGGLEGALEAAAADMDQLRALLETNTERTQDTIEQATAQLILDLQGLSAAVDERAASAAANLQAMEATSAALQQRVADQADATSALANRMEEVQVRLEDEVIARVKETSAAVSSLSARIARDYINREQLGAIFQARADMKRAVDELASVFSTGRLLRTNSSCEDPAATINGAEAGGCAAPPSPGGGTLSPRLVSALEDLAGKQAELEHQVALALYRTDGAVRQEQLAGLQQAMMTLELQFRRMAGTSVVQTPAASPQKLRAQPQQQQTQQVLQVAAEQAAASATAVKELSELRSRVAALEATVSAVTTAKAAGGAAESPQQRKLLAAAAAVTAMPMASCPRSVSTLRVFMTPEDPDDGASPIRLRLMVAEGATADSAMTTPRLNFAAAGPDDDAVGEPSLSSMLQVAAEDVASPPELRGPSAAIAAETELQRFRLTLQDLAAEVAAQGAERQRLAEIVSELQERLDQQVNATASTAAMVATMATDQPLRLQRLVALQDGGEEAAAADVASLAAKVLMLAARVEATEESLAAAFVIRTPRSPKRAAAAAAAVPEDVAAAANLSARASGGGDDNAAPPAETVATASASSEEEEDGDFSTSSGIRPALGVMVPVLPREVEQQLATLRAEQQLLGVALGALGARVDGLEAADALEEVRAAASEAVLDAIPGMVSQQMAVVREEMEALMGQQGEQMLAMAGQAARDAAEAVLAVREAAAEAAAARDAVVEGLAALRGAQAAAESAATEAAEARDAARAAAEEADCAAAAAAATASAREAALEVAMSVAREVAEETARDAVSRLAARDDVPAPCDQELVGSLARLAEDVKDLRGAVGPLTERINDVDMLRDQLEALAAQVRDSITAASSAAAAANASDAEPAGAAAAADSAAAVRAQDPPSTPTGRAAAAAVASIFTPAATALVIPPAHMPRGASPSPSGSRPAAAQQQQVATGSQQAAFLARLVAVVKRQSNRLHAQYSDAEETGVALSQVDHSLEEAEARLAEVRDANSPAFAETLVTVLEQVAALRYIGSQTHPAVQQMVLEHENRLDKVAEELKALSGGSPSRAEPRAAAAASAAAASAAVAEEVGCLSKQVARLEAELTRVSGQQTALDRAVKNMIATVGSVRLGSMSGASSIATGAGESRRASTHDGYGALPEAPVGAPASPRPLPPWSPPPPADTAAEAADAAIASVDGASDPWDITMAAAATLEVAGLTAQVRLLEDTLAVQLGGLRQELMAEIRARAGSSGGAAAAVAGTAADLSALDRTVSQQHTALTAIRNRLLAMQEYVDSTQGMIKDMHVGLGGLHRRVDALEASSGPASRSARVSAAGSADSASLRELRSDLVKFERRLLAVESSSLETAHALVGLKGLAPRVTDTEARLQDACSKLALALGGSASSSSAPVIPAVAPGASLPTVAGAVRALERRLGGRVEAACGALGTLAEALSGAGRIQAESTANPFKAISAAVNNPVIVAMEKKLETVRAELFAATSSLAEDMRRDLAQSQLESRLGIAASTAADTSTRAGSEYGGGAGGSLTFRP